MESHIFLIMMKDLLAERTWCPLTSAVIQRTKAQDNGVSIINEA
jgi:hypothetical protein